MAKTKMIEYYGPMAQVFSEVQGNTLKFVKDQPTPIQEHLADILVKRQPNVFKLSEKQAEPNTESEPAAEPTPEQPPKRIFGKGRGR